MRKLYKEVVKATKEKSLSSIEIKESGGSYPTVVLCYNIGDVQIEISRHVDTHPGFGATWAMTRIGNKLYLEILCNTKPWRLLRVLKNVMPGAVEEFVAKSKKKKTTDYDFISAALKETALDTVESES